MSEAKVAYRVVRLTNGAGCFVTTFKASTLKEKTEKYAVAGWEVRLVSRKAFKSYAEAKRVETEARKGL